MTRQKFYKKISFLLVLSLLLATTILPKYSSAQQTSVWERYDQDLDNSMFEGAAMAALGECVSQIATTGLINFLSGAAGDLLSSVGGDILSSITSGFGFGELGSALGGLSSIGGNFGSVIGLGGGTVPVSEKAIQAINRSIQSDTSAQRAKDVGGKSGVSLDGIAFCLANKTIENIAKNTMKWVQEGFGGNPVFVENPARYFENIAYNELEEILKEMERATGGQLCYEINRSKFQKTIVDNYFRKNYRTIPRCTLGTIVVDMNDMKDFIGGKFSSGSWDAWLEYTTNPQNHYYGSLVATEQLLAERTVNQQYLADMELGWNSGFHNIRDKETGNITTTGTMVQSQTAAKINAPIQRLTFADEFDELMNNLINNFIGITIGSVSPNP